MDQNEGRYVLVYRKTRLEELVERFNTWPQAKFYLEHSDSDPEDYLAEHDRYKAELQAAHRTMQALGRFQALERRLLPNYQFHERDVIVAIGQDGLVANTLKYLNSQPVIGVNPDPDRWDGVLLQFTGPELPDALAGLAADSLDRADITFAEAKTNDGQRLLAVNDLFIGPRSHTSARYVLGVGEARETQSSSGIIVSTGFGSTGWLQSILAGARGVYAAPAHELKGGFAWHEARLQFAVREPFPSVTTGTELVFGSIAEREHMSVESLMTEGGVIFSDGMERDYLSFNAGTRVEIGVSAVKGCVVRRA